MTANPRSCYNCRHGPFWSTHRGDGGKCFVGEAYDPESLRRDGVVCRERYERIRKSEMKARIEEAVE
jgi:hypothetical protein